MRLASVFSAAILFLVLVSGESQARPNSYHREVPQITPDIDLIDAKQFGDLVMKMSIREQTEQGDECTLAMYGDGRMWARILTKYGSACGLEIVIDIGPDSVLASIPAIAIQTGGGERLTLASYNTACFVEGDFNEKIVYSFDSTDLSAMEAWLLSDLFMISASGEVVTLVAQDITAIAEEGPHASSGPPYRTIKVPSREVRELRQTLLVFEYMRQRQSTKVILRP